MKRVLITGTTGFVGSHLAELLLERGDYQVYGTARWRSRFDNLHALDEVGKITNLMEEKTDDRDEFLKSVRPETVNIIHCELNDPISVRRAIHLAQPDYIFHLAAQSFVLSS